MIKKYIKMPISVEAVQWRGSDYTDNQRKWIFESGKVSFGGIRPPTLFIHTLEGYMKAHSGDYIVKGVDGEFYPVKKEIFEKTYREVKGPDPNAVCFKDGLNCEEEWIKQEKELEKSEWVCVKKDRLEELIESAYDDSSFCPLALSSICKWKSSGSCSHCKYDYDDIRQENETVKNVIQWLEGEENE